MQNCVAWLLFPVGNRGPKNCSANKEAQFFAADVALEEWQEAPKYFLCAQDEDSLQQFQPEEPKRKVDLSCWDAELKGAHRKGSDHHRGEDQDQAFDPEIHTGCGYVLDQIFVRLPATDAEAHAVPRMSGYLPSHSQTNWHCPCPQVRSGTARKALSV